MEGAHTKPATAYALDHVRAFLSNHRSPLSITSWDKTYCSGIGKVTGVLSMDSEYSLMGSKSMTIGVLRNVDTSAKKACVK